MKKLSRLMLVGIPFLAFSGVSFGDDSNTDNSKWQLVKVSSKSTYYVKSDDQPAIPVNCTGNYVVVNKNVIHSTDIYDKNMNLIHHMTWLKEGKNPILLSSNPVAKDIDASKAETTVDPKDHSINVAIHDSSTSDSDQKENKEKPAVSQPPAGTEAAASNANSGSSANASSGPETQPAESNPTK